MGRGGGGWSGHSELTASCTSFTPGSCAVPWGGGGFLLLYFYFFHFMSCQMMFHSQHSPPPPPPTSTAGCSAVLFKRVNQSKSFVHGRFQASCQRKSYKQFPVGAVSATCNAFQFSSLHFKVQEKIASCKMALCNLTCVLVIDSYQMMNERQRSFGLVWRKEK